MFDDHDRIQYFLDSDEVFRTEFVEIVSTVFQWPGGFSTAPREEHRKIGKRARLALEAAELRSRCAAGKGLKKA